MRSRATPANDGRSRMTRLSQRASLSLPAFVARPAYDRSKLRRGLVHLGLGAFHRAHQAIYTDAAMAKGDLRWGIAGVSLRSKSVAEALIPQDLLYNVLERDGEQVNARLVGALHAALYAPLQLDEVLDAIADPQTQMVTTTVTEKGYCIHPATGDLDTDDRDIQHDFANPDSPVTTIGVLFAGIRRRAPAAALTVLCCDNMASNGDKLRRLILQFARGSRPRHRAANREHGCLSKQHGRPHRPGGQFRIARVGRAASWRARRSGNRLRAVHAMGDRRSFCRGSPRMGIRRRLARERRPPLPGDEAPTAQRHPFGDRLPRSAARPGNRVRCDAGSAGGTASRDGL